MRRHLQAGTRVLCTAVRPRTLQPGDMVLDFHGDCLTVASTQVLDGGDVGIRWEGEPQWRPLSTYRRQDVLIRLDMEERS